MKRGWCLSQVAVVVVGVWEACLELPREQAQGGMRVVLQIQGRMKCQQGYGSPHKTIPLCSAQ